ncbi:MAG: hypothetical protein PHG85_05475 [Candidatus Altiarchaeota archaeon]|nr:hypothetical protein [Candidatus Altiarchaeota archaeon]
MTMKNEDVKFNSKNDKWLSVKTSRRNYIVILFFSFSITLVYFNLIYRFSVYFFHPFLTFFKSLIIFFLVYRIFEYLITGAIITLNLSLKTGSKAKFHLKIYAILLLVSILVSIFVIISTTTKSDVYGEAIQFHLLSKTNKPVNGWIIQEGDKIGKVVDGYSSINKSKIKPTTLLLEGFGDGYTYIDSFSFDESTFYKSNTYSWYVVEQCGIIFNISNLDKLNGTAYLNRNALGQIRDGFLHIPRQKLVPGVLDVKFKLNGSEYNATFNLTQDDIDKGLLKYSTFSNKFNTNES